MGKSFIILTFPFSGVNFRLELNNKNMLLKRVISVSRNWVELAILQSEDRKEF